MNEEAILEEWTFCQVISSYSSGMNSLNWEFIDLLMEGSMQAVKNERLFIY